MAEDSSERDSERLPPEDDADGIGVVRDGRGVHGGIDQVLEWVDGLPTGEDLIPLSQPLVSPELDAAFSIPPPDLKTMLDIHRAAQHTISNLRRQQNPSKESSTSQKASRCPNQGLESSAMETIAEIEGDSSSLPTENSAEDNSSRMPKRPRLVWTPQLHKRFVDVVAHLGIKNAVPKTIMQLMNVDGLTRENVASHLQKYRLYLKRMQGLSNDGPSSSDHLFASTPVPQSLQEQPMPYAVPTMIPMQVYGIPHHHAHGVVPVNNHLAGRLYNGFDSFQPYAHNDWSAGSKFASIVSNPNVSPNDNNRTGEKRKQ